MRGLFAAGHQGRIALDNGTTIGLLMGRVDGPASDLPAAGFAVDPTHPDPTQVLSELYGGLATDLLALGGTRHYLSHLDVPRLVRAVTDLGFGRISYCAVRPVDGVIPQPPASDEVTVRLATTDDLETIARLCLVEIGYRYVPPIYTPPPTKPKSFEDVLEAHRRLDRDGAAHFLATLGDEDVGVLTLESRGNAPGLCPDDQPFIGETATVAAVRGRGVGTALVEAAVRWSIDSDYSGVTVSFQPSNPVSRRFWLGSGFVPTGFWTVRTIHGSYATQSVTT